MPGARWFKGDLHIHTIDDHAGGRAKLPDGLPGEPTDPEVLVPYARLFVKGLVASGVQVAGLTPHSPRAGSGPETSAVWKIVEEWNHGADDDGVPFREKVFAVFPGFEPNVNDGSTGVHLLFLFDPEIGRERYLALYDAIMDGREPWNGGSLRPTPRDAKEIFETLEQRKSESGGTGASWSYISLAPHFQTEHGVLREIRSGVLERFSCDLLAGYELGDNKLPQDYRSETRTRPVSASVHGSAPSSVLSCERCLLHRRSRSAVHLDEARKPAHRSVAPSVHRERFEDAYWFRPARRMVGLRPIQRCAGRDAEPPSMAEGGRCTRSGFVLRQRKWRHQRIRFSPDLTCIIGGSMTGKSTLLDGLRVHIEAPMPSDESIGEQVAGRGHKVFGAGSPEVRLDCPGSSPTATEFDRWPAQFYAQNELRRLSEDVTAVEDILAKLSPLQAGAIQKQSDDLKVLDERLRELASQLARLDGNLADAEQAHERANGAKQALAAFSEAGVEVLHRAGRDRQQWDAAKRSAEDIRGDLRRVSQTVTGFWRSGDRVRGRRGFSNPRASSLIGSIWWPGGHESTNESGTPSRRCWPGPLTSPKSWSLWGGIRKVVECPWSERWRSEVSTRRS